MALLEGYDIQAIGVAASKLATAYHLEPQALGWLFSASLLGIFLGAVPGGILGDRVGRVATLTCATAIFGLFSILTPGAPSYGWLLAIRFVTGLGLGAAVPNMIAIVSGAASERWRQPLTTLLWAATPIGGIGVAYFAARGTAWQTVFYVGGFLPLLLAPILFATLPRQSKATGPNDSSTKVTSHGPNRSIWASFFLTLMILYLLLNWLPTLLSAQGLEPAQAALSATMFNLGGLAGAIVLGLLMRFMATHILVPTIYIFMIAAISGFLWAGSSPSLLLGFSFFAGAAVIGGQYTLYGVAATRYADNERSSAMGVAVVIGRVGAFIGPLLAGFVLARTGAPMAPIACALPLAALAGAFAFRLSRTARRDQACEAFS